MEGWLAAGLQARVLQSPFFSIRVQIWPILYKYLYKELATCT